MAEDDKKTVLDYQTAELSPVDQELLNKPLKYDGSFSQEDRDFLQMLIDKIEKKEIDLYRPSSLINANVYDKLEERGKGKADYEAFNMLATIREIYSLCKQNLNDTYQIEYMVNKMRIYKEKLEDVSGDIFII